MVEFSRANLVAMLCGATPNFYMPGGFDGGVYGLTLRVGVPGTQATIECSQASLVPDMPLQATLYQLTEAAARALASRGVKADGVRTALVEIDVHRVPPQPQKVAEVRPPAVAGGFYPGSPAEIDRTLDELFTPAATAEPVAWPAAIVPHAGWVYSGRLAAAVLRRLKIPPRVIVLCPKHRPGGADWAVAPHARWDFPGGSLPGDPELAQRLAQGITGLELDAAAHRQEHAIEVQLPLLARLAPQTRIVGIAIGGGNWPLLRQFGAELAAIVKELPERPLLLVSSDMNHFADETQTRQLDRLALGAIETLDPARLFETVETNRISMCGMRPAVIVMETLRRLGLLHRCEVVGYTTSAEASGDTRRVVGYAGVLLG
jgi:AmmeMemoRadiSam system protein B